MRKPEFLREIEDRISDVGLVHATHEILKRDNVVVDLQGEVEAVADHQGGILFAGNHRSQLEFVGLMDAMSRMGRTDVLHIARFCAQGPVRRMIGDVAADALIPVYPRSLAKDRGRRLSFETTNRIMFRKSLLTLEESARANDQAIRTASDHLAGEGTVNIYPCGDIVNWARKPWRRGIGNIIAAVPEDCRETTMVVPYTTYGLAPYRLLMAIAMRGRGYAGRPQSFTMHFGQPHSIAEVMYALPPEDRDDPHRITDTVRQWALAET